MCPVPSHADLFVTRSSPFFLLHFTESGCWNSKISKLFNLNFIRLTSGEITETIWPVALSNTSKSMKQLDKLRLFQIQSGNYVYHKTSNRFFLERIFKTFSLGTVVAKPCYGHHVVVGMKHRVKVQLSTNRKRSYAWLFTSEQK